MSFLGIALACTSRSWYVHPLKPADKPPISAHGFHDATTDEAQIRAWWTKTPDANVGISCGASTLIVWDADHGLSSAEDFQAWRERNGIPKTYTVRSGRRPQFAVQMYFIGSMKSGKFELDGVTGDIKSIGGYVLAAGSIHPKSKEAYYVLEDAPLAYAPAIIGESRVSPVNPAIGFTGEKIQENRNQALVHMVGKLRYAVPSLPVSAVTSAFLEANADLFEVPLPEEEIAETVEKQFRLYPTQATPEAIIGSTQKPVTDWRERYVTFEKLRDAKPTSFLIEGFLALDSITALAAPVGQRKSLIALNVAHALCTGEPLFDYFKVVKQPERVVYLCPEMGLSSFSTRLKQIGLLDHVGKNLFCQTMDDTSLKLSELDGELPGSVVILDTLTRFVAGDQNSSEDMSRFAQEVFRLKREGATVLLLHHSVKGTGNSVALTLDSAMRGSTELAAFVTSCWATRLLDTDEPYQSASLLVNCKQRDYESRPFETTCGPDCRMHIVGEPGQIKELKNAKDADAEKVLAALLKQDPKMGIQKLRVSLADAGFKKGPKWITKTRCAILGTGVTTSAA